MDDEGRGRGRQHVGVGRVGEGRMGGRVVVELLVALGVRVVERLLGLLLGEGGVGEVDGGGVVGYWLSDGYVVLVFRQFDVCLILKVLIVSLLHMLVLK